MPSIPVRNGQGGGPGQSKEHDMSFKDLTAKAAAAMKPKPAKTANAPAKANEPTVAGKEAPADSETS
ncbi:hypothetical protein C1J05_14050 [Sulfitobacter sp. JL08]|nr:hypothetical protein C1J05_14050 [Sulfitobacter sp. JL08]